LAQAGRYKLVKRELHRLRLTHLVLVRHTQTLLQHLRVLHLVQSSFGQMRRQLKFVQYLHMRESTLTKVLGCN
jgi:hypothetical protein